MSPTLNEKATMPPAFNNLVNSATWPCGSTTMIAHVDAATSNDAPGRPVSARPHRYGPV